MKGSMNATLKKNILSNAARYYENEFKKNKKCRDLVLSSNYYMKLKTKEKSYRHLLLLAGIFLKNCGFNESLYCYNKCLKLAEDADIKNKLNEIKKIKKIISDKFA
jgi:hypothetical protein